MKLQRINQATAKPPVTAIPLKIPAETQSFTAMPILHTGESKQELHKCSQAR